MRPRFWLGFAVVAAVAVGSLLLAVLIHEREAGNFERSQRSEAVRAARQAESLAALSVGQLSGAAAFYKADGNVDRREFEILADPLLDLGVLSATGFIAAVEAERKRDFERRRRLTIVERGSGLGQFRPAAPRRHYYPLVFAATNRVTGLGTPYGYDLGADRWRGPHLLRARDRGLPVATPVLRLPIGGAGINVFHPVYRDGAPTRTVAQRRAALVGFAVGSFTLPDITAAARTTLADGVDLQLVEGGRTVVGPELPREEGASATLDIADRTWLLVIRDPDRPSLTLPLLVAVFGLSMAALFGALVLTWSRSERMQELQRQASQDPLTGLKNRRRFEEDLRAELARSKRDGRDGALLMLDLDNFKQVNDTLGHPAGDRTIAELGAVLRSRMRATDVVARLGGDEFAIVLPRCDLGEAESVAREIAAAIRQHTPPAEAAPRITASIGIAPFGPSSDSFEAVLGAADTAMYEAKHAGRDEVRVAADVRAGT